MRFAAIHFFVRFAGGTNSALDFAHKPEGKAFLFGARGFAQGTVQTLLRQGTVFVGGSGCRHDFPPVFLW